MFLSSWLCGLKMVALAEREGGREREGSTKSAANSLADQKP
jgi:hypothetical protein